MRQRGQEGEGRRAWSTLSVLPAFRALSIVSHHLSGRQGAWPPGSRLVGGQHQAASQQARVKCSVTGVLFELESPGRGTAWRARVGAGPARSSPRCLRVGKPGGPEAWGWRVPQVAQVCLPGSPARPLCILLLQAVQGLGSWADAAGTSWQRAECSLGSEPWLERRKRAGATPWPEGS